MKNMFWGILLAFQFLTRIPIPISCPWNTDSLKWALRSYSLVGLCIGATILALGMFLENMLPTGLVSLCLLTLWVGLTGGLHLDGWMDVADAVGSNASVEKKWQIMKDPHVGSFGILALLFLLAWKAAFIYMIVEMSNGTPIVPLTIWFGLLLIPAWARFSALLFMFIMPTVKKEGLAWQWKKHLSLYDLMIASVPIFLVMLLEPLFLGVLGLLQILFIPIYSMWVYRSFQGMNGDFIGTAIEGGELWGLLVLCSYIWFVTA